MMKLPTIQFLVSLLAVVFSLVTVIQDFYTYYKNCGSVLPINSQLTHPFYTPCFYGSFAFLICLILSTLISNKKLFLQKYLMSFSFFGVAFAYSNMFLEIRKYLAAGLSTYKGCSGAIVQNPFLTPCFIGSIFFTLIMLSAVLNNRILKIRK